MIPILLGLNSSIIKNYQLSKGVRTIAPYYAILLVSGIGWGIVYFIFRDNLKDFFKLDIDVFVFSIVYAIILALKFLGDGVLKSQKRFKLSATIDIASTTIFVLLTIAFFVYYGNSYLVLIYPAFIAYFFYSLLVILKNLKLFKATFESSLYKSIIKYGFWAMVLFATNILFLNSDKLIINYFFNKDIVGIYGAHAVAASALWLQVTTTFISVFFPTIVAIKGKKEISAKLNRFAKQFFIPYLFLVYLSSLAIIRFFGAKYHLNNFLLILMSVNVVLSSFVQIKSWLIASNSVEDIKSSSFYWIGAYALYVLLSLLLIELISFYIVVLAAILVNLIILFIFELKIKRLKEEITQQKC